MDNTLSYKLKSKNEKKLFNKTLSHLAIPIAFQSFMTAAVSASDAIMLGFLNQESLSAVSLAGQITFVLNLFITVLVQGTTLLSAQYWGRKDIKSIEMIFGLVMKLTIIITSLFFICATFFPGILMQLFTNDPKLISNGIAYLKIAGFSFIPLGLSQIYLCIMKNTGRTTKNTIIASASMILNLILNTLLIFGILGFPKLGIQGAALATVISMFVQLIWVFVDSLKKDNVRLKVKYIFKIDNDLKKDFIKYILPVAGNYFFYGCGVTMYSVIIGHLGNDAVAANSIANIIKNLITCVGKGVATASGIIVGNALGENMIEKAKLYGKRLIVFSGLCGIVSSILMFLIRAFILDSVGLSPTALTYLSGMMIICSIYMIPSAIDSTVIGGIFCAGGKSKFGLFADAIVIWGIIIPLASLSAFYFKLPVLVVYLIICLDECIKIPAVFIYFKRYSWANNITR